MSVLVIAAMSLWAAHNFALVGEACRLSGTETYGELWSACISPRSVWVSQAVVTVAPLLSCLASTIVLTDVLRMVAGASGVVPAALLNSRPLLVSVLVSCVLFPLCSQPSFSALKGVSLLGLGGQLLAMLIMLLRLRDGSYRPGMGRFAAPLLLAGGRGGAPAGGDKGVAALLPLASLLSYCLVAHYNVSPSFACIPYMHLRIIYLAALRAV